MSFWSRSILKLGTQVLLAVNTQLETMSCNTSWINLILGTYSCNNFWRPYDNEYGMIRYQYSFQKNSGAPFERQQRNQNVIQSVMMYGKWCSCCQLINNEKCVRVFLCYKFGTTNEPRNMFLRQLAKMMQIWNSNFDWLQDCHTCSVQLYYLKQTKVLLFLTWKIYCQGKINVRQFWNNSNVAILFTRVNKLPENCMVTI